MQRFRRGTAAGLIAAACLLDVACTPATGGGPPPTAQPTATPTPSEDALSRQRRLDFAAAEKAYRTTRSEINSALAAGGATTAPTALKNNAAGPYLTDATGLLKDFAQTKSRQKGQEKINSLKEGGYSPSELLLTACQDRRGVELFLGSKSIGHDDLELADVTVRKVSGTWKVWAGKSQEVDTCG